MAEPAERKLAAILNADVVGYSRLMAEDEAATVRTLNSYRDQVGALVSEHRGRLVDFTGDNFLAEFPTATDAVEAAAEIQRVLKARNAAMPAGRAMEFRIGVHARWNRVPRTGRFWRGRRCRPRRSHRADFNNWRNANSSLVLLLATPALFRGTHSVPPRPGRKRRSASRRSAPLFTQENGRAGGGFSLVLEGVYAEPASDAASLAVRYGGLWPPIGRPGVAARRRRRRSPA